MRLAGLQKTTLQDFPGHVAAIVFTKGCNFRCPYCHNPELVGGQCREIAEKDIFAFLQKRRKLLSGVVVTGGEPTIQEDLARFLENIKALGFAVKLDTNGSRPHLLAELLGAGLVDYLAMDVKTLARRYRPQLHARCEARDIERSIELIINSGLSHEFRTTCLSPLVNSRVVEKLAPRLEGAKLWAFQACNTQKVLLPEYFKEHPKSYNGRELADFCRIAAPFVERCIVRTI